MLKATILRNFVVLGCLLTVSASAQVWIESGDAPSFPDGPAQVTRGAVLDTISGSTGAGDLRDAYCIRIVEPDDFLATTDPATSPTANADFDTRLFLFRSDGAPVLANDDTPPSQPPYLSTLTGSATDGSGFVLSQPGDYVLVVGGSPEDPQDPTDLNLFDIDSALDGVHAPNPAAGRFDHWEEGDPGTGSYEVFLAGVTPCQHHLDAVFANSPERNRVCLANGFGGFTCSDVSTAEHNEDDVALGFVDGDPYLDVVFVTHSGANRVCLGDGLGGFSCSDVVSGSRTTFCVALGFVDGDAYLDAIFGNSAYPGERNRVCLGDGLGGFTCSFVSTAENSTYDVALGFVDGDAYLDAVFANSPEPNRVCLGDGLGGFTCSDVSTAEHISTAVALGFVDGDQNLDAVFGNWHGPAEPPNRVCLGDGLGGFTCSDVSSDSNPTLGVTLGFLDGDQNLDVVFANGAYAAGPHRRNRLCLGDGLGGFTCSDVSSAEAYTTDVALGFVDGDSYLDVVFGNIFGGYKLNQLCLGNGLGGFTCSSVSTDANGTTGVALGEVDSLLAVLYCFRFDNFCDGIEITNVAPDKTVAGTWRNFNCGGETRPMLGGYSGKNVSPRLSWIAGDRNALLDVYSYNLNVDARTFDLFKHDTAFNLTQFQDDEPYSVTPGACSFGPEKEGLPASTGVGE